MLAGCSQGNEGSTAPFRDDIIIAINADISNLDPRNTADSSDFRMFELIFSSLVRQSEGGGFAPSIAQSWEMASDGLSYTFILRDDVRFHNGDLLTARDVVFSFERAMESPFVGAGLIPIASVTAVNGHTVRFDLHDQFAPFISSIQPIWIVSESVIAAAGDDAGREPIGTGPYMFVERQPGRSIDLTRFDDYFGGPAPIRDVTWMVIISPATASIAIEAGDVDLALMVLPGEVENLAANEGLYANINLTTAVNFLTISMHAEPFDNPLVREVVARTIDRDAIITVVAEGLGEPARGFLNELSFGYSPDVTLFDRDVDMAKELLAEAGFPDGFATSIQTIGGTFESIAQVTQLNLAEIGITATIEVLDQAVAIGNMLTHNYEIGILAAAMPGIDANGWSDLFVTGGGLNFGGHSDPDIDRWFNEARIATDPAARIEIYRQIAQRVNDTASFIPIYFNSLAYIHNSALEMGFVGPTGNFRVDTMRWVD